ncbi:dienelactone hydrolase family protein [Alsobacter soli]|uniref:Dienelactone hydrolase family protein n=1 Tax=Alsobacter soli TaxID=2109933 RepID=A0A2T1HSI9_9HYPH|nr:dienelactone hydrolase family protein [Alsobacter soli]PSC04631.1 dienelactone hydrolase family protein [Alsobacter soli]
MRLVAALSALLIGCFGLTPARAGAPERVRIHGSDVVLAAALYKPEGHGPFPAVVALHGCGGLFLRNGKVAPRDADWGERLAAQGFVVLMPDSYGPRALGPQCRNRDRVVRPSHQRQADAHVARRWLQAQPYVKPDAVNILGWSNGATTALYAIRDGKTSRAAMGAGPDFARAVTFYPGCRTLAESGHYKPRAPLLVLIGADDDWTPAEACKRLVEQAKAAGREATIVTYPEAVHDFDHPHLPLVTRRGIAFSASDTGEARAGTNPAGRADAIRRVPEFLAR